MISDQTGAQSSSTTSRRARGARPGPAQTTAQGQGTQTSATPGDQSSVSTNSLATTRRRSARGSRGPSQAVLTQQAQTASESRGTTLTDVKDIFRHEMSSVPGAKEKLAALTPEQRKQFATLYGHQFVRGTEINTNPTPVRNPAHSQTPPTPEEKKAMLERQQGTVTRRNLVQLLADGKLTSQDEQGQTLLSNLSQLESAPLKDGLDRTQLLRGTVRDLGLQMTPDTNIAKGELGRKLTRDKPADYARIVRELASPEGKSRVGSTTLTAQPKEAPETPKAPAGIMGGMGFGPTASSQLFQSSFDEPAARTALFEQDVLKDPKAGPRYSNMSATEKGKFRQLYQDFLPTGDRHNTPPPNHEDSPEEWKKAVDEGFAAQRKTAQTLASRDGLNRLLAEGTLTQKDSQGGTLLETLSRVSRQKMGSEDGHTLDAQTVTGEIIQQIDDPGLIHQNNKGTCTVITIEHLLARRQPAEYARVVGDLTSADGKVKLQDGTELTRDTGTVAPDSSNRPNISRVFQATMMEYGNGVGRDYRNAEDGHFRVGSGEAIKDRDGDLSSGLPDVGSRQVAESVMGVTSEVRTGTRGASQFARKRRSVEADMRRALSSGDAVQVGLRWSTDSKGKDGYHALSVTGFDDQYVYLRNPHGSEDSGNTDPTRSIRRETVRTADTPRLPGSNLFGGSFSDNKTEVDSSLSQGDAGSIRIKKSDFYENLSSYIKYSDPQPAWWEGMLPF